MKKIKHSIIIFIIILSAGHSRAAFLDPGWGARPTGMGGAFTAVSDDSNAVFFNPAGLTNIKEYNACAMHAGLFMGLDEVKIGLNLVSFAMPVHYAGGIGVAWTNLNARDLYREDTFIISYGHRFIPQLSGGVSLKYLGQGYTLDKYAKADPVFEGGKYSDAVTADLGVIFKPLQDLNLAAAGQNLIPADIGLTHKDIVPPVLRLGAAYRLPNVLLFEQVPARNIVTALDICWRFQKWGDDRDKISFKAGVEGWFLDETLPFRGGLDFTGAGLNGISLGTGFLHEFEEMVKMSIDYSFILPVNGIRESYGSHRVSLSGRF